MSRAWVVARPGPISSGPLRFVEREPPEPGEREVRVRVRVCGVCRTDLHVAEGDLPPRRPEVVPGHEVVGVVERAGPGCRRFGEGDRVGIAWLRRTCGSCRYCLRGDENLCARPRFTGWDDDGGYADHAVVHEDYAYELPAGLSDEQAAPLLCAGIIGYRALRRSRLPRGGRLAIYGFGASAHIAAQVAMSEGASVYVATRSEAARALALKLGAVWAGGPDDTPPEPADAAIVFAPSGALVPAALAALDRGGTLAVAGIHVSDIPPLSYRRHLFDERTLTSVAANTRADGREFLSLAAQMPLEVTTQPYDLADAERALRDLATGGVTGAAIIRTGA